MRSIYFFTLFSVALSSCIQRSVPTYLEQAGITTEWNIIERDVGMNMTPGTVSDKAMTLSEHPGDNERQGIWNHSSVQQSSEGTFVLDASGMTMDFYDDDSIFVFTATYTIPFDTSMRIRYEDQGFSVEESWVR